MFEKNQYKNFRLENDIVYWKNRQYPISRVKNLLYKRTVTVQKMNFVTVGESHEDILVIAMDDDYVITLSFDDATIFLGWTRNKERDFNNLRELYTYLSKATFQNRIAPYVRQVESEGFFLWRGWKFFPRENKIVISGHEFPLSEYTLIKRGNEIRTELRRKLTIKEKMKGFFKTEYLLDTSVSPDVIFTLLSHYMGLTWK